MLRSGSLTRHAQAVVRFGDSSAPSHPLPGLSTVHPHPDGHPELRGGTNRGTLHVLEKDPTHSSMLVLQPPGELASSARPALPPSPPIECTGAGAVAKKVGVGIVFDNRCADGLKVSSTALDSPAFRSGSIGEFFSSFMRVCMSCTHCRARPVSSSLASFRLSSTPSPASPPPTPSDTHKNIHSHAQ